MNCKILVIDDSSDMRILMGHMFRHEGYDVAEACNGRQALFKLENEAVPDLIFLDCMMEEMDGPQFLNELERTHPEILTNIPIIMLSGNAARLSAEHRASEILSKPFDMMPLLAMVKRYLH